MLTTQRAFRIESLNFRSRSSYSSQRRSSMKDWEVLSQNKSLVRNILEIQSRKPLFSDIFGGFRNGKNNYMIVGHSRSHVNLSLNKDRVNRSFHVDLPKATLVLSNAHTNLFSRKTHVLQAHQENTRLVNRLNRVKPALLRSPNYKQPGSILTSWNQSKIAASPQRCNYEAPIKSCGFLGLYQIQTKQRTKSSVIKLNQSLSIKRSTQSQQQISRNTLITTKSTHLSKSFTDQSLPRRREVLRHKLNPVPPAQCQLASRPRLPLKQKRMRIPSK